MSHDDCGFELQSPESFTGAHSIPDRLHGCHHGVFAMASTALGVICPVKNTFCQDRCHAARRREPDHSCLIMWSDRSIGQSNVWKRLFRRTFVLGDQCYLTENDAAPDAMSESFVPCVIWQMWPLSPKFRGTEKKSDNSRHMMWQKHSSKIALSAFSSQSLASFLPENCHDIRQMTVLGAVGTHRS
jgi:hypothetical protein